MTKSYVLSIRQSRSRAYRKWFSVSNFCWAPGTHGLAKTFVLLHGKKLSTHYLSDSGTTVLTLVGAPRVVTTEQSIRIARTICNCAIVSYQGGLAAAERKFPLKRRAAPFICRARIKCPPFQGGVARPMNHFWKIPCGDWCKVEQTSYPSTLPNEVHCHSGRSWITLGAGAIGADARDYHIVCLCSLVFLQCDENGSHDRRLLLYLPHNEHASSEMSHSIYGHSS